MLERVIFAIDNDNDTHVVAKFMRHVDTLRAMGKIDPVVQLVGCYKGQLERSYMMRADQFEYVRCYVQGQESILRVPGDVRQPCVLEYLAGPKSTECDDLRSKRVALGPMRWTYLQGQGKYFVCG